MANIMLDHDKWIFYTVHKLGSKEESYKDSFSGSIRLISEDYKLNPTEFIKQLLLNISSILPVDPERLESNGPYQIDTSVSPEQLIIPLQIKSTNDPS
ncbi:hypothetical protein C1645_816330 [Glomus cerebriforme]|uniref:Uncharacterized protein n=1 Tax=Glomus cerebriforme TaxID=658196 RepID=A0A397TFM9_9GLOM|nr:hypothetical protein C1645_816330 [Glomus cerebriforme]